MGHDHGPPPPIVVGRGDRTSHVRPARTMLNESDFTRGSASAPTVTLAAAEAAPAAERA